MKDSEKVEVKDQSQPELKDAIAYYNRGKLNQNKGQSDFAIADFTAVIKLQPKNAKAHFRRGQCYFDKDQLTLALSDFSTTLELETLHYRAIYLRGMTYFFIVMESDNKRMNEYAIQDLDKAIKLNPKYVDAYIGRALIYLNMHQLTLAKADLYQANRLDTENADTYFYLADVFLEESQFDLALENISEAIELNSKNEDAFYKRGLIYYHKTELDHAISDFSNAIKLGCQRSSPFVYRALAYYCKGELEKSMSDYESAKKLNLNNALAHIAGSLALLEKKQYQAASQILDQVLIAKGEAELKLYARVLFKTEIKEQKEEDSFFPELSDFLQGEFNDATQYIILARVYQISAEYHNAQKTILNLCKKFPNGIYVVPHLQKDVVILMTDPKMGFCTEIAAARSKQFKDLLKAQLFQIRNPHLKARALISALLLPQTFYGRVFYTPRPTMWRQTPNLANSKKLLHLAQELIKTDTTTLEQIHPWLNEVLSNPLERTSQMCLQLKKLNPFFYSLMFPLSGDSYCSGIELNLVKRYDL